MEQNLVMSPEDKPKKLTTWLVYSLQHVFAMFGATILVPKLIGIDPSVALITSGIGTLIYIFITKGKIPTYLGSSFAFITPLAFAASKGGTNYMFVGVISVAVIYMLFSLVFKFTSSKLIHFLFPPIVVAPIIIMIGLGLAPTSINNMGFGDDIIYTNVFISILTSTVIIFCISSENLTKILPFAKSVSILIGITFGYIISILLGVVDFQPIINANWLQIPDFKVPFVNYKPEIVWPFIIQMMIVSVATITENIGDHMVLSNIVGRDYLKKPGISRILAADGLAILSGGLMGGPVTTTYSENNGVIGVTKVASVYVILGAALIAVFLGFSGKVSAFISTIPEPILGGASLVLFSMIVASGFNILVKNNIDLNDIRKTLVVIIPLVVGVGGLSFNIQDISISGVSVVAIVAIVLNILLNTSMFKK